MTRTHLHVNELARTADASLATSRYAPRHEQGVLAVLRGLAPRRPLKIGEAALLAERQADRLLQLARVTSAPTPSSLIADLPRVLVRVDPDLPDSGATVWLNGRWLIMINGSEPYGRQRFSLVHEFKHALDHRHRQVLYQDRDGVTADEQAELAADEFAAALLMPKRWVLRAWREGIRRVSDLSDLFEVHPRAMAIRLDHIGLRRLPDGDPRRLMEAA